MASKPAVLLPQVRNRALGAWPRVSIPGCETDRAARYGSARGPRAPMLPPLSLSAVIHLRALRTPAHAATCLPPHERAFSRSAARAAAAATSHCPHATAACRRLTRRRSVCSRCSGAGVRRRGANLPRITGWVQPWHFVSSCATLLGRLHAVSYVQVHWSPVWASSARSQPSASAAGHLFGRCCQPPEAAQSDPLHTS